MVIEKTETQIAPQLEIVFSEGESLETQAVEKAFQEASQKKSELENVSDELSGDNEKQLNTVPSNYKIPKLDRSKITQPPATLKSLEVPHLNGEGHDPKSKENELMGTLLQEIGVAGLKGMAFFKAS